MFIRKGVRILIEAIVHGQKCQTTPVYGNRKGTKLMAGPHRYDLLVFHVNRNSGVEDASNYIKETDDTISVVDSYCLTDRTKDRATHSYKVIIRCDDVSNILSANFWPERIGCRLFEKRSRDPATPVPKKTIMGTKPKSPSTNIISLKCCGMRHNLDYINSLLCSK